MSNSDGQLNNNSAVMGEVNGVKKKSAVKGIKKKSTARGAKKKSTVSKSKVTSGGKKKVAKKAVVLKDAVVEKKGGSKKSTDRAPEGVSPSIDLVDGTLVGDEDSSFLDKAYALERRADIYERAKKRSESIRDIGELPLVVNPSRRASCELNLLEFLLVYFPHTFTKPFSPSHLDFISDIERTVLEGGQIAIALPRGSGKSVILECASLWAAFYGHRSFILLIGSTVTAASDQLDNIKFEVESNDLLFEDFPEICYPIRCLEGIALRAKGQMYKGVRTSIGWTGSEVVFPTIEGSSCSGSTIRVSGITGQIRGMRKSTPTGNIRPDYVLIDDIQTEESAKSVTQCNSRLGIINSAILGLAAPGTKMSCFLACTVISEGDVADTLLDREKHPQWNGVRVKMLIDEPESRLWDEYSEVLKESLRVNGDISEATEFYLANRKELDAGGKVYWEERFNSDEASALQHAMNIKILTPSSFASEFQNEPMSEIEFVDKQLDESDFSSKLMNCNFGEIPNHFDTLVAYIDIQKEVLWYSVVAGNEAFDSHLVEYGSYPKQHKGHFDLSNLRYTLSKRYKGSVESNCYEGLNSLVNQLMDSTYKRLDGIRLRFSRILIDAAWGDVTQTVYRFCQASPFGALLLPSFGRGITASNVPMTRWRKKAGETHFQNCIIKNEGGNTYLNIDTNFWKSFFHNRVGTPMGERATFTIYGHSGKTNHSMLYEHLTSEYFTVTSGHGRTLREYRVRASGRRNDWYDCIVGCHAALHLTGIGLDDWEKPQDSKRLSLSKIQNRNRNEEEALESKVKGGEEKLNLPEQVKVAESREPAKISLRALQRKRRGG